MRNRKENHGKRKEKIKEPTHTPENDEAVSESLPNNACACQNVRYSKHENRHNTKREQLDKRMQPNMLHSLTELLCVRSRNYSYLLALLTHVRTRRQIFSHQNLPSGFTQTVNFSFRAVELAHTSEGRVRPLLKKIRETAPYLTATSGYRGPVWSYVRECVFKRVRVCACACLRVRACTMRAFVGLCVYDVCVRVCR